MYDTAAISQFSVVLAPGDTMVLYTDGVTEAPRYGAFFGEAGIARVLGACAGQTAQRVADAVVAAALDFQGGLARDDIAVVVIGEPPGGTSQIPD
jgi:serine phosphatase RsbU (regulator of sigma subunit)